MKILEKENIAVDLELGIDEYLCNLKKIIDKLDICQIETVIQKLIGAYKRGAFIYIFGNGGSAATASHFVNDFNKDLGENLQKRFHFICLNDNIPSFMAIANDISYDQIFKFQLENYLHKDDLVIAISGSGNSQNVIKAVEYANAIGAETVGLVGYSGGILKNITKYCIHVPANDMQKTEDIHLIINHILIDIIKKYMER